MKRKLLLLIACCTLLLIADTQFSFAQGVTTGGLIGKVTDGNESLPGATVLAVHVPTGSRYGNVTDASGLYRIPNMKAGGPYKVTITFVGYNEFVKEDIFIKLGQSAKLDAVLSESATQLEELVISAEQGGVFDANRNGVSTSVSEEQLAQMPNASRTLNDFVRLTPQAAFTPSGGISIAGTNNRYNSIFIDGAVSNDVFGLADNGQNGGQIAGLSLISMDALEQIQVDVSPYNITLGGFAGGSISAVTRSGTNEFEGSVYYLVRNDGLAGKTPGFLEAGPRERLADFTAKTYGMRLGGPIIEDELFFFLNAEKQNDQTPRPFSFRNYNGGIPQSEVDNLVSTLRNTYGYDPGSYEDVLSQLKAEKIMVKFDYNINEDHKLTLRHSYNKGENFSPSGSSTSRIRFENGGVFFPSKTNSTTVELNSNFGNSSNKLIIGRTSVRDDRDPMGANFPYVDIVQGDIEFGSEQFSTANTLDQDVTTITNNFNLYRGKHTWTFGTHNEFYKIRNVFIRQNFGYYEFDDIASFLNNSPNEYATSYSLVDNVRGDGTGAAAEFSAIQLGFYVQDEIQVTDKMRLTAGIRVDIPMFTSDPATSSAINWSNTKSAIEGYGYDLKGAAPGKAPGAQFLIAPRFGFNYDAKGDQTVQVRGGIGVFTSRVPFVWPGGMFNNNGLSVGGTFQTSGITFNPDPNNQPTVGDFGGTDDVPQGQMDLFVDNFKYPQVLRASFGVDHKLPFLGLIASAELIISKTLNNVFYENLNLKPSTQNFGGTPDRRPIFNRGDPVDGQYSRIILGSNTNQGSTKNVTFSLQKPFDNGLTASISYNYGTATAIFEGTSSQNSSQWRKVYSLKGRNNATLGRSDYDAGSRIVSTLSYGKEYLGFMATTVSVFYNGQSGSPFSYTYNRDISNQDSQQRSLIYVPVNQNEIVFDESDNSADAQWNALDAYISNDSYLKNRRGQYAQKNMARTPFTHIFDVRFLHDFYLENINGKKHTLQLSFDIFNFGNLIGKNWGQRWIAPNADETSLQLLDYEGSISGSNGETIPTFSFAPGLKNMEDRLTKDDSGLVSSRWQMQFGIRYSF
ncbi:MAG: TonB-dependent receptor [Cyclobacteriaceae bacterium]